MNHRLLVPITLAGLGLITISTACQRPRARCCAPRATCCTPYATAPQVQFVDPGMPMAQGVTPMPVPGSVQPAPMQPSPAQPAPGAIDTGALYATRCAKCHGDKGQGSDGAPALIGPGALAKAPSEDGLAQYIQQSMPPEGHGERLTMSQARALAEFAWKANGK